MSAPGSWDRADRGSDREPGEGVDEQLLDDVAALEASDPSGVLRALAGAGAQVRRAVDLAAESGVSRLDPADRPRSVVIAARGGSAVVADAIGALAGAASPVPVIARTGDVLPGWVGPLDLVVAVSLSGRSAPGVTLLAEAGRRGARVLTVGREDSSLARVSAQVRGIHVATPAPGRDTVSAPTTRTALWSLLTPVLLAGDRLGLFDAGPEVLLAVADALDDEAAMARPSSEVFVNPAKTLAVELGGSVPVVLGDGPLAAVAARRAASVLARTARVPALAGMLPDDAGDVVATFGGPFAGGSGDGGPSSGGDVFHDPYLDGPATPRLRLLLLEEHGPDRRGPASSAVLELAERSGVRVSTVSAADQVVGPVPGASDGDGWAEGGAPAASPGRRTADPEVGGGLARMARLIARTDFAATYLALATGADPAISPHVADLRDALQ